jgi:hypothetical protein
VIILIQLFKRTSSLQSKSKILETILKNKVDSKKYGSKSQKNFEIRKNLIFPWWFKIILYLISFALMAISICFVTFKGIDIGDDNAKSWLVSFIISTFFGIFVTLPIQVKNFKLKRINLN